MLTLLFLLPLLAAPVFGWSYDNHTCAIEPRFYSCENTTADFDSCCSPGNSNGLVLVTQCRSCPQLDIDLKLIGGRLGYCRSDEVECH